jgi:di/tricarboxylate transporter
MIGARWLLPRRGARTDETSYLQLDRYYTELVIEPGSPWIERTLGDFQTHFEGRLNIAAWLRGNVPHLRAPDATLKPGDVFVVRAAPDEIASVEHEPGIELHAIAKYGESAKEKSDSTETHQVVQVVVAPHSQFIGRSIAQIDFLRTLRVVVIGLWRKDEWLQGEISQIRLREGDLLLLNGAPSTFAEINQHRGFLMMVPFSAKVLKRNRAIAAIAIVVATIACAAANLAPTQLVFLAGAVALVVCGCASVEQAYREIDVRIYVMIAGVVPLGLAMEKTGTAAFLAGHLQQLTAGWSSFAVLLTLFWAAALLTQILSDAATAVLLVPISLALAAKLGLPPQPFAVCTALGAVVAFLTPIGHHGNLLILNPGQYRFADFIRVGVPLTIVISLVCAWLAGFLWLQGMQPH